MKIAPDLVALAKWNDDYDVSRADWKRIDAQLRALLAVARAAGPVSEWIQAQKWRLPSDADLRLSKSLARLRRASAAAGEGKRDGHR